MTTFVDRVVLHVRAGDGGHGCASIHREKFKPLGGPDGGDGGHGGDVILVVDTGVASLLDYHFHPHKKATSGKPGHGGHRNGAQGETLVLPVPDGTVVSTESGEVLADLTGPGTSVVIAKGGHGGLGNSALASAKRKAPGFALFGEPGEGGDIVLTLKSVADVALVGFPSAGKSSLISVLSAARPKIADYPFTTLVPNLGVVTAGGTVYTVADVPGLIPGASQGKGLGLEFLRHVERCAVLVHVLDCGTLELDRDPLSDLDALEHELAVYDAANEAGLADRPRLVVLNKVDLPEAKELAEMVTPMLVARGYDVFSVSALSREGLKPLSFALAERVAATRDVPEEVPERIVLRPKAVDDAGFDVIKVEGGVFQVTGEKPGRWVVQTDFSNDEAVGYLGDRLARLGIEQKLAELGAVPGDEVRVGDVVFDWEPTSQAGAEISWGRRGTDMRVEDDHRIRADERRKLKDERRAARLAGADPSVQLPGFDDDDDDDDDEDELWDDEDGVEVIGAEAWEVDR